MSLVALVRGPFLNPYEMAPYQHIGEGIELVAVAARRSFTESDATGLEVRRLRCLETELSVRHGRMVNLVPWFLGRGYWMIGMDRALADADLIHTAETYFGFSLQAARVAQRRGRPLVVTVKETIPEVERLHPIRRRGHEAGAKAQVRDAARLFLPASRAAATALIHEGISPDRMEIVPPAVEVGRFLRDPRDPGEVLELLFVGPALWRKGLIEAVRSLALVREKRSARLTIAGRGVELKEGMRIAHTLGVADAITAVGKVPYARMPELYRRADILVAPSIPTRTWQEQDSMAVLEAMAAGLPVVATAGGIRKELLHDDAYWSAPGDFVDLAERILEVAAHPEEAKRRGQVTRERARAEHDLPLIGGKLRQAYERALN
jgi:glycosyltransferase involved in cell wall biosynthesis